MTSASADATPGSERRDSRDVEPEFAGEGQPESERPGLPVSTKVLVGVVLGLLVGLLVGVEGARFFDGSPSDTSIDAGFARDMQTHHAQAVEMAMLVRDRSDDESIDALAYDIATTQQQQAGQMYGWLEQWGLRQTGSEPVMAWMDRTGTEHGHQDADTPRGEYTESTMPGMATPEQLDALRAADGVAAERLFLELMITHHEAGVEMAEAAAGSADTDVVRDLARSIVEAQSSEIALLEDLLAARR